MEVCTNAFFTKPFRHRCRWTALASPPLHIHRFSGKARTGIAGVRYQSCVYTHTCTEADLRPCTRHTLDKGTGTAREKGRWRRGGRADSSHIERQGRASVCVSTFSTPDPFFNERDITVVEWKTAPAPHLFLFFMCMHVALMRRLVCAPSYYGLTASRRAFLHPFHSLFAYADNGTCRTPQAVRHCACNSSTADHRGHEAAHISHTSCQRRISSFDRPPLLRPPLTPCSIGGTPFMYLLQRIIVDKTERLFHMRREALEFLCNVAAGDSATRRHDNATEEATTRERRMRGALLRVAQPALHSSLQQKENPLFTVCLQRPEGHVCVPAVVGETYVFLRSQGVDVAAWWERYYTTFIRPSMVERPGSEGMVVTAATDVRDVERVAASPATDDCGPNAEWNGATRPPPLYWKLDWGLRPVFSTHATTSHSGDVFAVPLLSFEEPAPWGVAPAKTQTDGWVRGSDGVPASTGAAAAALASPPTRQSVWIPVWLIRHLPFFPIPFPSTNAEGEPRQGRSAEMRYNDATFASAGSPLTSHDRDSCMGEENERVPLQRDGEPETTEADSLLFRQDAVSRTNAFDDVPLGVNRADTRPCTSWRTPQTFISTPRLHTRAPQDQLDKEWGHPFFDDLHSVSDIGNRSPRHATLITSSGDHDTAAHDMIYGQALRHLQRVRESSTFALDLEFSIGCLPTNTTTGAFSAAPTAEWPSPLSSWKLRSTPWRCLSSFWATKADPASSLAADYVFPLQAYPLLRYRSLLRRRVGHTAISTCRPHLRSSAWSTLNRLEKDTTSSRWVRYPFQPCGAAQQHADVGAQLRAHRWIDGESPLNRMSPTTVAGDDPYRSEVFVAARRAPVFHVLLSNAWAERVAFFGVHYVSVDATALSCLFDSTVCVQQAVPLEVTGTVFKAGLRSTRYRQQHSCLRAGPQRVFTVKDGQGGACASPHRFADRGTEPRLPLFAVAMKKLEAAEAAVAAPVNAQDNAAATLGGGGELGSTVAAAPWLARLRAIRNECERGKCEPQVSPMERVVRMRTSRHSLSFLFQSPYWVEVAELYRRWGVRVAPGTVPLLICGKPYVNAEQTTDASRFSPSTCVPHLMQEVLCGKGLGTCTWAGSQSLLSLIVPGAAPRRRPGGVCAWTYRTLCERAAAVQRVSNLWITESVVERFKWTLRTVPAPPRPDMSDGSGLGGPEDGRDEVIRAVLPLHDIESSQFRGTLLDELHGEVLHRHFHQRSDSAQHAGSWGNTATPPKPRSTSQNTPTQVAFTPSQPWPPPCEPPVAEGVFSPSLSRHTAQPHVSVVHSSCVVEQAELAFVAAFSPVVLLLRVPDLTSRDWGFHTWKAANLRAATGSRSVEAHVTGSVSHGDGVGSTTDARAERPLSSYNDFEGKDRDKDDQAFHECLTDDGTAAGGSESVLEKRARLMYMKAIRRKRLLCLAPWRGTSLSFQSRLDLSRLALRKGYSAENAHRWVSLDFLRDEPRVRTARTDTVAPKLDTQVAGEFQIPCPNFASDPAAAESSGGRQAGTSSRSRAITAIKVDVLFYSQDEPDGSSRLRADGGDIEYDHGACSHGNGATDDYSAATRVMTIALINYEELEWPDSVVSSSEQQWVWKNF